MRRERQNCDLACVAFQHPGAEHEQNPGTHVAIPLIVGMLGIRAHFAQVEAHDGSATGDQGLDEIGGFLKLEATGHRGAGIRT